MTDWAQWLRDKLPPVAPPDGDDDAQVREALARHGALDEVANGLSAAGRPLFGAFLNDDARRSVRETLGPELDERRAALVSTVSMLLGLRAAPGGSMAQVLREAARQSSDRVARFGSQLPVALWLELVRENEALVAQPPRSSETRAVLEAELSGGDRTMMSVAIRALGWLGETQAVPVLREKLKTGPDAATRAALITAVVRCTGNTYEFRESPPGDRAAAVLGLSTASAASEHLSDAAPEVVEAAGQVLRGLKPENVVKALAGVLTKSEKPGTLRAALELLEPHVAAFPSLLIEPLVKRLPLSDALLAKAVSTGRLESAHRKLLRTSVPPGSQTAAALELRAAALRPAPLRLPAPALDADDGAWEQFATVLTAAGDVRGQAISRALDGQKPQTFLTKNPGLLGPLPEALGKALTPLRKGFEYRRGLISGARVRVPDTVAGTLDVEDVLEALLAVRRRVSSKRSRWAGVSRTTTAWATRRSPTSSRGLRMRAR